MNQQRQYTLKELVDFIAKMGSDADCQIGSGCDLSDEEVLVDSIANLATASSTSLSFLSKAQYVPFLSTTLAGVVIVQESLEVPETLTVIRVKDPYLAYAHVSGLFSDRFKGESGVHPSAHVDPTAMIASTAIVSANCVIGPHAIIGERTELQAGVVVGGATVIGADCLLYANTSIYHGVTLGDRVTIQSCSAIGSDGFGFSPSANGWVKIHQLGGVIIGNDVEIGSCTSIDRGALEDTVIEDGVIIDNQVHIAHNVHIGKNTAIAGCVGIAGSTKVGANCTMGGFVAINGHLTITDNVHFNGGTVVTKSISESGAYSSGTLLQDVKSWRKTAVRCSQMDSWVERIKKLEKANY